MNVKASLRGTVPSGSDVLGCNGHGSPAIDRNRSVAQSTQVEYFGFVEITREQRGVLRVLELQVEMAEP